MKNIFVYLLCLICFCVFGISCNNKNQTERYGHLNILMKDLQNLEWNDDEAQCLDLLMNIIKNVQNSTLWATWIWDSMQSPVGHLYGSRNNYGNYDECVEFPWEKIHPDMRTQYCLTRIQLSEVDFQVDHPDLYGHVNNYIRTRTKHHLKFNTLTWGVCTPAACKQDSVVKFTSVLFRQTHLALAVDKPNISVNYCDVAGDDGVKRGFGFYFTIIFIASAVMFTFLATSMVSLEGSNSKITKFFMCFHIPTNVQSLVTVTDNEVRTLFGVRVITSFIVIGLHVWWLMKSRGVSNGIRLDKDYDTIIPVVFTIEMVVDTFLFLSGLLFIKGVARDGLKRFNLFKVILKRYIRLVWPVSILLLTLMTVFTNIAHGPAAKDVYKAEIKACFRTWWASILMVQNYVDVENMCCPVLWSVACDFHLSVLGTFIVWIFSRSRRAGVTVFISGFIASIAVPAGFVIWDYQLYSAIPMDFRLADNYRKSLISNKLYISSQFRTGPYFVGMAIGYLISRHNPVVYRNIITKKYSILGFCIFLAMFIGIFMIGDMITKLDYSPFEAALYLSTKRVFWAVSIGVLIVICEYGTLPLLTGFLSWSAWAPFSKLSYGIYMVHGIFVLYPSATTRNPLQYDFIFLVLNTFGIAAVSSIGSLCLWTFCEAPMQNIVALSLRFADKEKSREVRQEHIKSLEGVNDKKKQ